MIVVYEVWNRQGLRLATLRLDEALSYARRIYRETHFVPTIEERDRTPVDHTKRKR